MCVLISDRGPEKLFKKKGTGFLLREAVCKWNEQELNVVSLLQYESSLRSIQL
jgi:hypothetical protein